MTTFKDLFESESGASLFHTSTDPISKLSSRPMWLDHHRDHVEKRVENNSFDGYQSHVYSANLHPSARLAHFGTKEFDDAMSHHGVDGHDYVADMVSNPSDHEILSHPGTKALQASGYHGMVHPDYHPADPRRDTETTLVFNPSKHLTGWKKHR